MRFPAFIAAFCTACLFSGSARAQDAQDPARHRLHIGFEAGVSGLVPFSGYADRELGGGVEAGFYLAIDEVLLLATIGADQSFNGSLNRYTHVPADVMVGYFFDQGEHAPFAALGLGLHYLDETVFVERTVGTVLRSTSHDAIEDSVYGLNLRLRMGVVVWRTGVLSLMGAVDYDLTLADFEERNSEQAVRFTIAVIVGGGH